jgi:hypothetical protein
MPFPKIEIIPSGDVFKISLKKEVVVGVGFEPT